MEGSELADVDIESIYLALRNCLVIVGKVAIFFVVAKALIELPVHLNTNLGPNIPWSIPAAAALLAAWTAWLAPKWIPREISIVTSIGGWVAALILLSVLASLAVLIFWGALFSLVAGGQSAGPKASPMLGIAWALAFPILGAFYEEITFRGILQGNLERLLGRTGSFVVVACIFVGMHGWNPGFVAQFGFYVAIAVTTGLAVQFTRSITPAIAIHAIANGALAALILSRGSLNFGQLALRHLLLAATLSVASAVGIYLTVARLDRAERGATDRGCEPETPR